MPSYEYYCRQCDRTFTVHMSLKDHETEEVRCVYCQGTQVEQVLTSFVAVTNKDRGDPCGRFYPGFKEAPQGSEGSF